MIGLVYLLFGNVSHFSHSLVCTIRRLYIIRNYKWGCCVFECVQSINTRRLNHTIRCSKDKIFFSLNLVIVDQLRASSDQKQIPSRASASVQTHIGGSSGMLGFGPGLKSGSGVCSCGTSCSKCVASAAAEERQWTAEHLLTFLQWQSRLRWSMMWKAQLLSSELL